jgi:hypothetical protein
MYVPAGSVTPGSATDWLNVKYVRLSNVSASAPLAMRWTSTTNTEAENNLFNMLVPPAPWERNTLAAGGTPRVNSKGDNSLDRTNSTAHAPHGWPCLSPHR